MNIRNYVLLDESLTPATVVSCRVTAGNWTDAYTGEMDIVDPAKLDVDHMVPLHNAHSSGGWAWDRERRRLFANDQTDPEHLIGEVLHLLLLYVVLILLRH